MYCSERCCYLTVQSYKQNCRNLSSAAILPLCAACGSLPQALTRLSRNSSLSYVDLHISTGMNKPLEAIVFPAVSVNFDFMCLATPEHLLLYATVFNRGCHDTLTADIVLDNA